MWKVAVLHSRQMQSQAFFRAIITIHPWFSSIQEYMRKKYHCGQNLLWTRPAHNILTTVITHIVVDKSTDNAKPHFIC